EPLGRHRNRRSYIRPPRARKLAGDLGKRLLFAFVRLHPEALSHPAHHSGDSSSVTSPKRSFAVVGPKTTRPAGGSRDRRDGRSGSRRWVPTPPVWALVSLPHGIARVSVPG